jgi:hypothetical protein
VCGAGCIPGGAPGDPQCAAPAWCSGAPTDSSGTCQPDAPNGEKPGGMNCNRPGQCISNVCHLDGLCGLPDGLPCPSATVCRSAVCLGGVCGGKTGCTSDAQCPADDYCGSGTCQPKKENSQPCSRAGECRTALCHPDGKCGAPNGDPCGSSILCRSNLCDPDQLKCIECKADPACGGPKSGKVCDDNTHTCVPGCRGMNGNGCPDPDLCTSPDATIGQCVQCKQDADCGDAMSARICVNAMCGPGCRGKDGNGCPTEMICSSTDATPGTCGPPTTAPGNLVGGGLGACAVGGRSAGGGLALLVAAALLLVARRRRRA